MLEVRGEDQIGLLHELTSAIFSCHLDVVAARVSTVGSAAIDAFYVRTADGDRIEDPAVLAEVEARLLEVLTAASSTSPGAQVAGA